MSDIWQQEQPQEQQYHYHPKRNITASVATAIYILCTKMTYDFHKNDNGTDFRRKSAIKSSSTISNSTTTRAAVEEEYDYDSSSTTKSNNNNNNNNRGFTSSTVLSGASLCCGSCFNVFRDDDHGEETTTTIFDFTYASDNHNIITGDAFDIIFVESVDGQLYQNSDFLVSFTANDKYNHHKIVLEIEHNTTTNNNKDGNDNNNRNNGISKAWFPIIQKNSNNNNNVDDENCEYYNENDNVNDDDVNDNSDNDEFDEIRFWGCCHPSAGTARPAKLSSLNSTTTIAAAASSNSATNYDNSTTNNRNNNTNRNKRCHDDEATSKLKPFLKRGRNPIRYLLLDEHKVVGVANANIFLWKYNDSVVVSDIDGTITKSNARGVIDTIVTDNYRHCHKDICNLLSHLASRPTTQIVYITSRPLALANPTRNFLQNVRQGQAKLPEGPLLGFGGKLPQLLLMELVSKTTHHFKSQTLWKQIVQPFRKAAKDDDLLVFLAGFGNSMMDVMAYHSVGIHTTRLFKISKDSKIVTFDNKGSNNSKTMMEEETAKLTTSNDGILNFRPHKWYKERIGTVYFGYSDPRLISLFNSSTEIISSDEVQPTAWA
jgi:phosphatidate phosphatase PAH1